MKYVWITIVVIIIAVGALWYVNSGQQPGGSSLQGGPLSDPNFDPRVSGGGVVTIVEDDVLFKVDDQVAAGSVTVSTALLEQAGFIAIHKNAESQPGDILGTSHFLRAGNNSGTKVVVKTSEGTIYFAALYYDDGDEIFDTETDQPALDPDGSHIVSEFTTVPRPDN